VKVLEKELPREIQRRDDRVALISAGDPEAMQAALAAVLERIFDRSGLPEANRGRRQLHTVEVLVPEKSSSHIVGQGGERIRALIEETGCDMHVSKEPLDGLMEQKRVRVTADSTEEATNAVWKIQETLMELASGGVLRPEHFELREPFSSPGPTPFNSRTEPNSGRSREVPIRLLFGSEEAAWIIGKRGNKIMNLRDLAKVSMNDAEAPPFDPSDRVVEISSASLEQRVRVVQMIIDDLNSRDEVTEDFRLLVPTDKFGSVMGHRGEHIRKIMSSTGAELKQHKAEQLEDGSFFWLRLVEVSGGDFAEVVLQVHQHIEGRNRDAGADSHSAPSANNAFGGAQIGKRASPNVFASKPNGVAPFTLPVLGCDEDDGEVLMLELAMPSVEVARSLAADSSGIAGKSGVQLTVARGPGDTALLQVEGTALENSVACYFIQDRLHLVH